MFWQQPRCSFCDKLQVEVAKLVSGRHGYICDRCVAAASRVLEQARSDPAFDELPAHRSVVQRLIDRLVRRGSRGTFPSAQRVDIR